MKQYVVDELRLEDYRKLKTHLDNQLGRAGLDGLYWKPMDDTLLTDTQAAHTGCAPFCVALVLTQESLICELLVRTRNRIRCECIAYATPGQLNWLVAWLDKVFSELDIIT
jgi:hypothetical protein